MAIAGTEVNVSINVLLRGMEHIQMLEQSLNGLQKKAQLSFGKFGNLSEQFTTQLEDNSGQAKILTQDLREMGILGSQSLESIQRQAQAARKNMLFLGLGTLFFGMALQRLFGGIMKTGVDTFRQITEATEGSQSALTGINAGMTFLQFTIGDTINTALEPFLPLILAIIDAFTDFMQQNPWTGWVIIGGVLAGMALLTFGTLTAFMSSIGKTFSGDLTTKVTNFADKLSGIAKLAAGGIGISLLLQGMEDFKTSMVSGISKAMEGAGMLLLATGKTKEGMAVYGIGAALQFIEGAFQGDLVQSLKKLVSDISGALIIGGATMGALGIPIIVLGVMLKLLNVEGFIDMMHQAIDPFIRFFQTGQVFPERKEIKLGAPIPGLGKGSAEDVKRSIEAGADIENRSRAIGGGQPITINMDNRGALFPDEHSLFKISAIITDQVMAAIANATSTQPIR